MKFCPEFISEVKNTKYATIFPTQWRNRRGARGQSAPPTRDFWPGNFCSDVSGKKRQGRKGKRGEVKTEKKRRKIEKGRWKSYKMSRRPFFFFFFFFFFCFSLVKTTKICFGSTTKMGIFYREKTSGKMTLPPQRNMPVTPLLPIF